MGIPVVHAGSVLPVLNSSRSWQKGSVHDGQLAEGFCYREADSDDALGSSEPSTRPGYVRDVSALDYEIRWVSPAGTPARRARRATLQHLPHSCNTCDTCPTCNTCDAGGAARDGRRGAVHVLGGAAVRRPAAAAHLGRAGSS